MGYRGLLTSGVWYTYFVEHSTLEGDVDLRGTVITTNPALMVMETVLGTEEGNMYG